MNVDTIVIAQVIAVLSLAVGGSVLLASLNYPRHIRRALQSYAWAKLLLAAAFLIAAFRDGMATDFWAPLANGLASAAMALNYVAVLRMQNKRTPFRLAMKTGVLVAVACFLALRISPDDLNLVRAISSVAGAVFLLVIAVELLLLYQGRGIAHYMSGGVILINFLALVVRIWANASQIGLSDSPVVSDQVERGVYAVIFLSSVIGAIIFLLMASDEFNKELKILANTDGLTGVLIRRRFLEIAEIEFRRAKRHGRPLTLLIIDIDRFKAINDQAGHPFGDRVIKAVADCCVTNLRSEDSIGRLGGEEFAILLPESDLETGERIAERIRANIERSVGVLGAEKALTVTCSVGGVTLTPDHDSFASLIEQSDAALYEAKDRGRNRVHFAKVAA
jgi:diguanylate cyclase (GGDEF)-like protein